MSTRFAGVFKGVEDRGAHASISVVDRSLELAVLESTGGSRAANFDREARPSTRIFFAGATVRVHASSRGNHAFISMDRSMRESDALSQPAPCGNKRLLELDLDYLERRGGETITCENTESGSKEEESPADTLDRVKVVFLGAPGVGKSSIIRQFVWSEFSEEYKTTKRRETFYPSVVLADRLYELKITDLPMIPYFPVSSHLEWADFRYYGLRSANAYVLVFDLSNQDTFQYIRTLREQIYEARDMRGVPLLVVGNKQDELSPAAATGTRYRDIVNLVRKHWRCGYVECSARFNCRVVQVFRELMKSIQAVEGRPPSPAPAPSQPLRSHPHDTGEKCILL